MGFRLKIEVRATHPFAQNAKGWGTHYSNGVCQVKAWGARQVLSKGPVRISRENRFTTLETLRV